MTTLNEKQTIIKKEELNRDTLYVIQYRKDHSSPWEDAYERGSLDTVRSLYLSVLSAEKDKSKWRVIKRETIELIQESTLTL